MIDLLQEIQKNLIDICPILNRDGSVDRWAASYRYVDKITGQNFTSVFGEQLFNSVSGDTPEIAIQKLLKFKRNNSVI